MLTDLNNKFLLQLSESETPYLLVETKMPEQGLATLYNSSVQGY
jgi:hypothetical protein